MLKRYRAAAMNGVSVQEFTERLLPILSKEIEVNHSDSEDEENSAKDTKQSPEAKRKRTNPSFCTEVEESESEDDKKVAVSFTCPHCLQEFDFSYPHKQQRQALLIIQRNVGM